MKNTGLIQYVDVGIILIRDCRILQLEAKEDTTRIILEIESDANAKAKT